jgi:L-lactate dehydrogenase
VDTPDAKVTIVGSGAIGSTIAYSLFTRRPGLDLVLRNRDERKAWAKVFDISHSLPESGGGSIRSGSLDDTAGSAVVVVTAGVLPRVDGTRSEVLRDNIAVYRELVPALAALSPQAVFLVVTNPVDSMAYAAWRLSGLPPAQVIGSGTLLDGTRLRCFIAQERSLDPASIEAQVIGEHGDTMVPLWSGVACAGEPLALEAAARARLLEKTRRAGWDIRAAGEHSCYGIAFAAVRAIEAVLGLSAETLTVSSLSPGEAGYRDIFVSLPSTLGRGGIVTRSMPKLSDDEARAFAASEAALGAQMDMVDRLMPPKSPSS